MEKTIKIVAALFAVIGALSGIIELISFFSDRSNSASKEGVTLETPAVWVENTTLHWNAVENAVGYTIMIDGASYNVPATHTSYSLSKIEDDDHFIQVKANGDGETYLSSSLSRAISYRKDGNFGYDTSIVVTVHFDTGDGAITVPDQPGLFGGAFVGEPPAITREGYTFDGWYLGDKRWAFDADTISTVDAAIKDITLTARWTEKKYTISFDTKGGTAIAPITADYGTAVTPPADPTRNAYIFKGWYLEGTLFSFDGYTAERDITLTAEWELVPGAIHPSADGYIFNVTNAEYTGKEVKKGVAVILPNNSGGIVRYKLSYQQIDPATGEALSGVAAVPYPIEAGTYNVTVSFEWGTLATDEDKASLLPEPETKRFVVARTEISDSEFGTKDYEAFYYPGMKLGDLVVTGNPPFNLVRQYALAKVDDENGTNPIPQSGTVITAAGYYQVTVTYAEPAGKDNISNEDTFAHTAIVFIRDLSDDRYQIKKAEGIVIDGVIDDAYMNSAWITSKVQEEGYADDPTKIVNPYEYVGMTRAAKGSNITTIPDAATNNVTLRLLWGKEDGEAFLYVIVDVNDSTPFERATAYTAVRNAWVNDSIEFSYKLGGNSVPTLPTGQDTYPTYSTVLADSRAKTPADDGVNGIPNITAVAAQKSLYFGDIESATVKKPGGYIIELKIPAKSESFVSTPGYDNFARTEGKTLTAGEFVFICLQQNNLTGVPEGYADYEEYDAQISGFDVPKYGNEWTSLASEPWRTFENESSKYIYSSGNRNRTYLNTPGAGPAVFQLSNAYAN